MRRLKAIGTLPPSFQAIFCFCLVAPAASLLLFLRLDHASLSHFAHDPSLLPLAAIWALVLGPLTIAASIWWRSFLVLGSMLIECAAVGLYSHLEAMATRSRSLEAAAAFICIVMLLSTLKILADPDCIHYFSSKRSLRKWRHARRIPVNVTGTLSYAGHDCQIMIENLSQTGLGFYAGRNAIASLMAKAQDEGSQSSIYTVTFQIGQMRVSIDGDIAWVEDRSDMRRAGFRAAQTPILTAALAALHPPKRRATTYRLSRFLAKTSLERAGAVAWVTCLGVTCVLQFCNPSTPKQGRAAFPSDREVATGPVSFRPARVLAFRDVEHAAEDPELLESFVDATAELTSGGLLKIVLPCPTAERRLIVDEQSGTVACGDLSASPLAVAAVEDLPPVSTTRELVIAALGGLPEATAGERQTTVTAVDPSDDLPFGGMAFLISPRSNGPSAGDSGALVIVAQRGNAGSGRLTRGALLQLAAQPRHAAALSLNNEAPIQSLDFTASELGRASSPLAMGLTGSTASCVQLHVAPLAISDSELRASSCRLLIHPEGSGDDRPTQVCSLTGRDLPGTADACVVPVMPGDADFAVTVECTGPGSAGDASFTVYSASSLGGGAPPQDLGTFAFGSAAPAIDIPISPEPGLQGVDLKVVVCQGSSRCLPLD